MLAVLRSWHREFDAQLHMAEKTTSFSYFFN